MSSDTVFVWVCVAVGWLMILGSLLVTRTRGAQDRRFLQFWHTTGLPIGTELMAATVRRRIRTSGTVVLVGALTGLLAASVILLLRPELASPPFVWLVALPATLIGASTLDLGLTLRQSRFLPSMNGTRPDRSPAVVLADYVSPGRLRAAPLLVIVAAVLAGTALWLGSVGVLDLAVFLQSAALPVLVVAGSSLVAGRFASRRILRQAQSAGTDLEQAWDDAFRAETLRSASMFQTMIAWLAVGAVGLGILNGWDAVTGTTWSTGLGSQLFTWGYLATIIWFSHGSATGYSRRHLWSNLAPTGPSTDHAA
ncbi:MULTISPECIES: hypothetical protein [unclassified Cryobacterium]|uniref:hypothetical protein n=1 Tax=unclassified Cryobacterium TaxID=2649013 RepID=UPI00106BC9BE|nr:MULTISPECIES: hypothetical protein [unclassified Cryobacterium]TFB97733.1 hypothetical protein E3O39_07990 [Cryobacterium sp. MDB2-A-1]TFC07853.1 hypothetical protein E3O35_18620 [Cryobacterium sp. MDB2-A-2]TFC11464.1 hypothetical protein E3O59_00415 [Cryobacterium sp. MDB2-33-2]TFC21085.1 hypothetical protein E3O51_05150 [Cryobacterium sp. MDB2-10]